MHRKNVLHKSRVQPLKKVQGYDEGPLVIDNLIGGCCDIIVDMFGNKRHEVGEMVSSYCFEVEKHSARVALRKP